MIGLGIVALLALANKRSGFVGGVRDLVFQQMGSGVAVAVLIDATLVRTVLVRRRCSCSGRETGPLPPWLSRLPTLEPADVSAAGTKSC